MRAMQLGTMVAAIGLAAGLARAQAATNASQPTTQVSAPLQAVLNFFDGMAEGDLKKVQDAVFYNDEKGKAWGDAEFSAITAEQRLGAAVRDAFPDTKEARPIGMGKDEIAEQRAKILTAKTKESGDTAEVSM